DWRDGAWVRRRAGFGGELRWFPDPVGGRECQPAALVDATLLQRAFPGAKRLSVRLAATATERIGARLPELRKPAGEGGIGAVRVELRGERAGAPVVAVYGAIDRPAVAAGAVAAHVALRVASGTIGPGARAVAELDEPLSLLQDLASAGIKAATFTGSSGPPRSSF
nr:hypothetical protein [Acidimicrobiia bacterium]